ncbi:universal stress protein [Dyadobacter sp. CY343]|uniref:universal stress protein n=1 Tax=Dyadobacter sp. CY343 TaxID=2907299 RepID=UPI001F33983A|nr:universal stress protein [Dyadobacter sp. CY343]MCE7059410.1 universal stress protein [Dyadobacter sp. CY343]
MKKILVPCDFSTAGRQAVGFAREIAQGSHGEVKILHVIEARYLYGNGMADQPYLLTDPSLAVAELMEDAEKEFEKMKLALGETSVPISLSVETGPLIETVINVADRENVDMIAMSTMGAQGFKEFFVGSSAEKTVRRSPIPVFVTHQMQHLRDVQDIIVPTSMNLTENEFLTQVKTLQARFDAILHVLYINNYPMSLVHDEEATVSLRSYANF